MSWEDRLKTAAYTAPSGSRIEWDYEDVSRSIERKTQNNSFPDVVGSFVQNNGSTGYKYPIKAIFSGEDCDLQALGLEDLLNEDGVGKLEHPLYGTFDVVPSGNITRVDNLKSGANQSIVTVTLIDSSGAVYDPTGSAYSGTEETKAVEVETAITEQNDAIASSVEDNLDISSEVDRVTIESLVNTIKATATSALESVADVTDDVSTQFNAINDSIDGAIEELIEDPILLAYQISLLVQAPAASAALIADKLSAYESLAESIFSSTPSTENELIIYDLFGQAAVAGSVSSTLNNDFETKSGALESAESVIDLMDDLITWRDTQYGDLGVMDSGAAYQQLQEAVALCTGYLVQISFSLKRELTLTLTRARTVIDLCAELYGEVDDKLDFLINSNDLTGDEILELPKGRDVVYYV